MQIIKTALLFLLTSSVSWALPDLSITDFDYNRNGVFTAVVSNTGTTATPAGPTLDVGYTVDGVYRTWGIVTPSLAAGASVVISMNGPAYVIANGAHTVDAFVDDDNKFAESNETNNHYIASFTINTPDTVFPAFPGAQGGGAVTTSGGRGGTVIPVTNLNNSGAGSFRACAEGSGARICVFRVAGTISLTSSINVLNGDLTIAGQTAPGGGIQLEAKAVVGDALIVVADNVIVQGLKIRHGYITGGTSNGGNLRFWGQHEIADHNSLMWNMDEGLVSAAANDITFSNNLIAEGLAGHSTALLVTGNSSATQVNVDIHHNLMMNNTHRAPLFKGVSGRVVNNIIYNLRNHSLHMGNGVNVDAIGNFFKKGPNWAANHEIQAHNQMLPDPHVPGDPSIYLLGNKGWNQTNPAGDQWLLTAQNNFDNDNDQTTIPAGWKRTSPLSTQAYPITAEAVTALDSTLVPHVGAGRRLDCSGNWVSNRDAVDSRLITEYTNNTASSATPTTEADVGGYPTIASGTPCTDTDNDGLPDEYEILHGLNINVNDSQTTKSLASPSFSYLELFLQGVDPCIFNCGGAAPVLGSVTCTPNPVQSVGTTSCTVAVTSGSPISYSWTTNTCAQAQCTSTSTGNPGTYICALGGLCTPCVQANSANGLSNLACSSANYLAVKLRKPTGLTAH